MAISAYIDTENDNSYPLITEKNDREQNIYYQWQESVILI